MNIEGRPPLQVTPLRQRGWMMGPLPLWAEVAYAAVEDKTEGIIAVDGNMLGIGVDVVSSPIFWTVRNGRVVKIDGERDAKRLAEVVEGVPNVEVIGEFAFGTSHKAPLGSPSEKGRIGNVHFAMGDNKNAYPGGQNVCRLHLDGVVRNATLQILDTRRLHLPRRAVGSLDGVRVVPLEDVPPVDLPGGELEPRDPARATAWDRRRLSGSRASRPARPRPCSRTRPRSSPTSSRVAASSGSTMRPSRTWPARRSTSRRASGTPS